MLSALQQRIAQVLSSLPEAGDFALAGGAALIFRGDVDRRTRDLDFFCTTPEEVDRLLPILESALSQIGLIVDRRQVAPGFARLVVSRDDEHTEVDLAADARLRPTEASPLGPLIAGEELAADKVLALFGRAEARDFVDLLAVEPRYGLEFLCELAAAKDRGFRIEVFREMLGRFTRLSRDEFEVDDATLGRLTAAVERWREQLAQ